MWEIILTFLRKKVCAHDWEEIKEILKYGYINDQHPVKRTYIYKCKKCGKLTKIVII